MEYDESRPVENTALNYDEIDENTFIGLINSKNYKDRIIAYGALSRYPHHIALVQNETMVPALEPALDALLTHEGKLASNDVNGIFVHAAQSKPGIRAKISTLIDKILEIDEDEMIESLCSLTRHKNVKLVERIVSKLSEVVTDYKLNKDNIEKICGRLEDLMSAADKSVRQAASTLCVGIYQVIYDKIYGYIGNIKPIQLKELKGEFEKYSAPKVAVNVSDLKCDDSNWKERLASMNILKDSMLDSNNHELIGVLTRRLKDANIQVVCATVETVRNGKVSHPEVIKGTVMRFKDRKGSLTQLIKETIASTGVDSGMLINILCNKTGDLKNPDVKIGLLDCLLEYSGLSRVEELAFLLDDGNADVRIRAAKVLSKGGTTCLSDSQKAKISKLCGNAAKHRIEPMEENSSQRNGLFSTRQNNEKLQNDPVRDVAETSSHAIRTRNESFTVPSSSCRSVDDFITKYPLFKEKEWSKRLGYFKEAVINIRGESIQVIVNYFLQSKESNFNLVKEFLSLLSTHPQRHGAQEQICSYAISKLCEGKLRNEILTVFKSIDNTVVIEGLLNVIQSSGSGKRLIAGFEILCQYSPERNPRIDKFISEVAVVGMAEKGALEAFKLKYLGESATSGSIPKTVRRTSISGGYSPTIVNVAKAVSITSPCKDAFTVFKTNVLPKNSENLSETFTSEFLALMEEDPYSAIGLLSKYCHIAISGTLIRLYCVYYLPSSYFSALIHDFISQKYILVESEAIILVHHLLSNTMGDELDLLDRIYPATRLYKVYRSFVSDNGIAAQRDFCCEQISKLVYKCKRLTTEMPNEELAELIIQGLDFMKFVELLVGYEPKNSSLAGCKSMNHSIPEQTHKTTHEYREGVGQPIELRAACPEKVEAIEPGNSSGLTDFEDSFVVSETAVIGPGDDGVLKAPSILHDSIVEVADKKDLKDNDINSQADPPVSLAQQQDLIVDIESSIANLSITNMSIASTPRKKKRNFNEIEDILNKLIHADTSVSSKAFERIIAIVKDEPSSLLFLSNSLVSSSIIQLFDKFLDLEFRKLVLEALLRLTQNVDFCLSLRYETLKSAHVDLARIITEETAAADTLINLCLNCGLDVLKVYFDLLENNNELILKLIWRHSKRVDYTKPGIATSVLGIVDSFYQRRGYILHTAENVLLKVCLLHLKDVCINYSDGAKKFGVGQRTNAVIDLLLCGGSLNLDEIRLIFK
ncbi:hypothetical protein PAEPH01_0164 [Pancytospora epiphaga]|nr:hypothetical protein PAEPH01_0164 [Pancytospora epiphaga]